LLSNTALHLPDLSHEVVANILYADYKKGHGISARGRHNALLD